MQIVGFPMWRLNYIICNKAYLISIGESNMPSEDVLEEYDANGDGLYSPRELANAFGFNLGRWTVTGA